MVEEQRLRVLRVARSVLFAGFVCGCAEQGPAAIEQGTRISALPTQQADESSGAGSVAGVILGTTTGALIGQRGIGQFVGAAFGGAAGGAAGTAVESAGQSMSGVVYTIKMHDDRVITIVEHLPKDTRILAAGTEVEVETRGRLQHVKDASEGK